MPCIKSHSYSAGYSRDAIVRSYFSMFYVVAMGLIPPAIDSLTGNPRPFAILDNFTPVVRFATFSPQPHPMIIAASRNWAEIRNAYVNREIQPSLDELADEFGSTPQRISRMSVAESWPLARAERLEKAVNTAETTLALAHAIRGDQTIQAAAKTAALGILRELGALGEELAEERSKEADPKAKKKGDRARAGTLNDMSFALANVSKTMRDLGITGVAKHLEGIAGANTRGGNGAGAAWSPSMLSQINVTLQNMTAPTTAPTPALATVAPDAPARSVAPDTRAAGSPVLDADPATVAPSA